MAESSDNPLLKALPPETDYLSYLTILEYNLNKGQLPILHDILQDTTLTANIGWDLIHLLLPLLPESVQCLTDIAHLGNPREVILKVTESLEELARKSSAVDVDAADDDEVTKDTANGASKDVEGAVTPNADPASTAKSDETAPTKDAQFNVLLALLCILLPRIKTKYPSRFLSTTLQAVLSTYNALSRSVSAIESILAFSKRISGTKRPALPPRISSSSIPTLKDVKETASAPDPEANTDGIGAGEAELQKRLFQSFITFVAELYFSSLQQDEEDAPGMSYTARYQEKVSPEKNIPHRRTVTQLYGEESYHLRDTFAGQILALTRDLGLTTEDLLTSVLKPPDPEEDSPESELPSSASDVPLSPTGSLYLLACSIANPILFDSPPLDLPVPDVTALLLLHLPSPTSPSFANISPSLLDTLLFLGTYILNLDPNISPTSDTAFTDTLQRLSLLSAQIPSPSQRYQAHRLASSLLHLHSSSEVKLAYIKDTLEHCPYDNLKGSAVGWIKDEILAANDQSGENESGIFASADLFDILGDWLWGDRVGVPMYTAGQSLNDQSDEFAQLQNLAPFYLGVLNLLFLLLSNKALYERYGMAELVGTIKNEFLDPLLAASKGFEKALGGPDSGDDEEEERIRKARVAEMQLLAMNVTQVVGAIESRTR